MRILIIGARGYVGSAVAEHMTEAGHEVVALVRKEDRGAAGEQRVGDLADPSSLSAAVTPDLDAVVNLATPTGDEAVDAAAVDALTAPLRGTGRAFVYTSGVWVLGATGSVGAADESAPTRPIAIVGYRPAIERRVLATAAHGVRACVIRPGIVHGRGGGIPALLADLAVRHGHPLFVGEESVRWPMVHLDDLADLFVKVVEDAPAGTLWHAVAQEAVPVRALAAAAGRAAGVAGEARSWDPAEARAELGEVFADALALDQSVSGQAARDRLGWRPRHTDAVEDVQSDTYGRR
jgi:nucleoside-diphosphate-sugar epimerase